MATLAQAMKGSKGIDSSTLSFTSELDRDGWPTPRPGRFIPVKETRYPMYWGLGGPQGQSGRVRKITPLLGFDPRAVQLVLLCVL